jgi:two-component system chemotaxis sensor kinase CheA
VGRIQITPEMKRQFRSETAEHLQLLENMLMVMEHNPDQTEAIHSAFRCVHSIKGNSDYLGIEDINALAHTLEDLMDDVRGGKLPPTQAMIDAMFKGLDLLKDMNRRVEDADYAETDIGLFQKMVDNLRSAFTESKSMEQNETDVQTLVSDVIGQDVRVNIARIDRFMEHMAEFAIAQSALEYLIQNLTAKTVEEGWEGNIRKISENLKKVRNNFQADLMAIRLVKLDVLFNRLLRVVRDLSRKSEKRIEIKFSGGEIEVDRKIMIHLIDPLVHLVRNAVDHGIETTEERVGSGKPETGIIAVSAGIEGGKALIEVSDDGHGLNTEKIRQTALNDHFVSAEELARMSDSEVNHLIFLPGFTTCSQAGRVSGRGVGMDVAASGIKAAGGVVSLCSKHRRGTRVSIRVPVSMSVTEVLLVRADQRNYAFPFAVVRQALRVRRGQIRAFKRMEMILYNCRPISIRHLSDRLRPDAPPRSLRRGAAEDEIIVIVLGAGGQTIGFSVDAVLRRESVVIRPIHNYLSRLREFSGAAVLGDGRVVMVLDPLGLV